MKKRFAHLFAALFAVVFLFTVSAAAEVPEGIELAEDQTIHLLLGNNVSTFDFQAVSWTGESEILNYVLEGLFRIEKNEDGKEVPTLVGAESYEVSEDGLTYTFHLRDSVWSDGVPVTAQQYVDAYIRGLDASLGLKGSVNYFFVKNGAAIFAGEKDPSEVGVTAVDDKTLVIELETASIDALEDITASAKPLRKDLIDSAANVWGTDVSEIAYNGPFIIESFVPDSRVVLRKNPSYWDADNIIIESAVFSYVAEAGTQATLFDTQQLDVVEYNEDYGEKWNAQAEAGEIAKVAIPRAYIRAAVANQAEGRSPSGLMGNAKIRLALSLAINREEFVETIFGRYEPAYDYVAPVVTVNGVLFNTFGEGTVKDLQAEYPDAESLRALFKAGLDELNYAYTDLSDITLVYADTIDSSLDEARVEYLAQNWEDVLGINIDVAIQPDSTYKKTASFDLSLFTWNGGSSPSGFIDDIFNLKTGQRPYLAGYYESEELQALLDSAVGVTDPEEVARIYQEAEEYLIRDGAVMPIYWADFQYFQQNYVAGIEYKTYGNAAVDWTHAYILAH